MTPELRGIASFAHVRLSISCDLGKIPEHQLPDPVHLFPAQLGARISEAKHRQLKLAAIRRGVTVQVLVEPAIQEFLTNHPELLQSSLVAPQPAKSTPRRRQATTA